MAAIIIICNKLYAFNRTYLQVSTLIISDIIKKTSFLSVYYSV